MNELKKMLDSNNESNSGIPRQNKEHRQDWRAHANAKAPVFF